MKFSLRTTLTTAAASLVAIAGLVVATLPAQAANQGQIAGGNIYRVKNLTAGGDFGDPINADKCQELQYKVRLHNPGPGVVHQVTIKVTLPSTTATSNVSTATVSAIDADPATVSDTATVNLSSAQSISYESGTTQLLDDNNNFLKNLPDGITQGGVAIGDVGVSLNEIRFVQFKAKISCPETPPPPQPTFACNLLDVSASNDDRTVKITVFTTTATNGATFKNAVVDWGDNSSKLTTDNPVGKTHSYDKAGTFTISAVAHFTVNGQDMTSDGPACAKTVTFSEKSSVPPTVTPPSGTVAGASTSTTTTAGPSSLVNTGPGSLAAVGLLTAALAAYSYRRYLLRHLQ
jgi:hypothetical protein